MFTFNVLFSSTGKGNGSSNKIKKEMGQIKVIFIMKHLAVVYRHYYNMAYDYAICTRNMHTL